MTIDGVDVVPVSIEVKREISVEMCRNTEAECSYYFDSTPVHRGSLVGRLHQELAGSVAARSMSCATLTQQNFLAPTKEEQSWVVCSRTGKMQHKLYVRGVVERLNRHVADSSIPCRRTGLPVRSRSNSSPATQIRADIPGVAPLTAAVLSSTFDAIRDTHQERVTRPSPRQLGASRSSDPCRR